MVRGTGTVASVTPLRQAGILVLAGIVEAALRSAPALWVPMALAAGLAAAALLLDDAGACLEGLFAALVLVAANRVLLGAWAMPGEQPLCGSLRDVKVLLATLAGLLLARCGAPGQALIAQGAGARWHGAC